MGKPRDQFGFLIGSKKSRAAGLYVVEALSTDDMRNAFGSSFINLLYEVAAQGHQIQRGSKRNYSTRKFNATYKILLNEDVPYGGGPGINWFNLTIDELKKLGFKARQINDLLTIWLIPSFLHRAIPNGLEVYFHFEARKNRVGQIEPASKIPFKPDRMQDTDHLCWGLIPQPRREG